MLRDRLGVSERWACKTVGQHRSPQRRQPVVAGDEEALRAELQEKDIYVPALRFFLRLEDTDDVDVLDKVAFYHRYYLRPKPILRIIRTMLEDKDVCVRRLREGYEFFKSMAERRNDLAAAKAGAS